MADKYEQTTVQTQARKSEIVFLKVLLTDDLLNTTEVRAVDSEMKVHFVDAGVLVRKFLLQ